MKGEFCNILVRGKGIAVAVRIYGKFAGRVPGALSLPAVVTGHLGGRVTPWGATVAPGGGAVASVGAGVGFRTPSSILTGINVHILTHCKCHNTTSLR